jgi:aromatic ring-opening dioxygenase LigB subunit
MSTPWVSPIHDQLIPVNKVVNEKKQLEKRLEEEDKKYTYIVGRTVCHFNLVHAHSEGGPYGATKVTRCVCEKM